MASKAADLAGVLVPGRMGASRGRTLRHTHCAAREWLRASPVPGIRPGSNEKKLATLREFVSHGYKTKRMSSM